MSIALQEKVIEIDEEANRFDEELRAPVAEEPNLSETIAGQGIILIVLGILHFVLAGFLDPGWGAVLIVLGILNLLIRRRGMFIVNGLSLVLVGLLNTFLVSAGGWTVFGLLQMYWGVQEIRRFGASRPA